MRKVFIEDEVFYALQGLMDMYGLKNENDAIVFLFERFEEREGERKRITHGGLRKRIIDLLRKYPFGLHWRTLADVIGYEKRLREELKYLLRRGVIVARKSGFKSHSKSHKLLYILKEYAQARAWKNE